MTAGSTLCRKIICTDPINFGDLNNRHCLSNMKLHCILALYVSITRVLCLYERGIKGFGESSVDGDKDVTLGRTSSRSEALSMVYKVQEQCIVRFNHEYNALYTGLVSKVGKKEERYIVTIQDAELHTLIPIMGILISTLFK